eukprot:12655649-Alexandrium_andersonii.AAC.1
MAKFGKHGPLGIYGHGDRWMLCKYLSLSRSRVDWSILRARATDWGFLLDLREWSKGLPLQQDKSIVSWHINAEAKARGLRVEGANN